jgi:hypothetical protein
MLGGGPAGMVKGGGLRLADRADARTPCCGGTNRDP